MRAEVATEVSLDGIRRSEKAEVLERTDAETSEGSEVSGEKKSHNYTHIMHITCHAAAADVPTAVERLLNHKDCRLVWAKEK